MNCKIFIKTSLQNRNKVKLMYKVQQNKVNLVNNKLNNDNPMNFNNKKYSK